MISGTPNNARRAAVEESARKTVSDAQVASAVRVLDDYWIIPAARIPATTLESATLASYLTTEEEQQVVRRLLEAAFNAC